MNNTNDYGTCEQEEHFPVEKGTIQNRSVKHNKSTTSTKTGTFFFQMQVKRL